VCLTFVAVLTLRLKLTLVSYSVPFYDQVIPKDYALAHFPHKNQTITFQLPGQSKKWHCEFRVRPDGGHCSRYWWDFSRDNHLLEGDHYLFQPMKKAKGKKIQRDGSSHSNAGIDHPSSEILPPQWFLVIEDSNEASSSRMVEHPPHLKFKRPARLLGTL
jgi:hypothetical protein